LGSRVLSEEKKVLLHKIGKISEKDRLGVENKVKSQFQVLSITLRKLNQKRRNYEKLIVSQKSPQAINLHKEKKT
jgi:hypothetical protein